MDFSGGYQSRLVCNVYYAPDDPHVTNPNQAGYVGSNAPGGGYSGSGTPSGGGGGGGGTTPPSISSGSSYSGSSSTLDDADRQAITAMGYAAWAQAHNAAVNGGAGGYAYNPNSGGGSAAGGYNFNGPSGFASLMGTDQPTAPVAQTWDTLDGTTRALFSSVAGSPKAGQALWEAQNAGGPAAGSNPANFGATNYVQNMGNGQYVDNLSGALTYYPTEQAAEQAYNTYYGKTNAPSAGGATAALGALPLNDPQRTQLRNAGSPRWNDPTLTQADYNTISKGAQNDAAALAEQNKLTQAGADAQRISSLNSLFGNGLLGGLGSALGPGLLPLINSALQGAGQQPISDSSQQAFQQQQQSQTAAGLLKSLLDSINSNGPLAPGETSVVNASLQALGLPAIQGPAAQAAGGLVPNGITPAMWDAMPVAAKNLILLAWQARGGDPNDFTKGIDAQRPAGSPNAGGHVNFAPLAA